MTSLPDAVSLSPLPAMGPAPTRSGLIVESLKSAIFSGTLRPGETLVERRIADQLGVSKTPVREALIVLERSGLVATANRRIEVRRLSFADVRHIYEQRVLLEPWAIEDAARIDPGFTAARQALDDARQHAKEGNTAGQALANRRFHRGMYSNCENDFVVKALDSLQDLTALAVVGVLWERWPRGAAEAAEHEAIYEAAHRGDAKAAAAMMRDHITASIDLVRQHERRSDAHSAERDSLSW
ncbi:GntR family transcriptional regulator [Arthrobacter sp. NPDC055138]